MLLFLGKLRCPRYFLSSYTQRLRKFPQFKYVLSFINMP
ncbi:unnamed protein product [Leptidea sinapis]|uniref:Uncharacterized protein n=1 Tax=Leptidea sinapis TaxID=189913 RepID=A0A5E4PQ62_9NEOP|nr:unnamed protein product [Leptidea sinapis]